MFGFIFDMGIKNNIVWIKLQNTHNQGVLQYSKFYSLVKFNSCVSIIMKILFKGFNNHIFAA